MATDAFRSIVDARGGRAEAGRFQPQLFVRGSLIGSRGHFARGWQGSSQPHVGRGSRVMERIREQREHEGER